MENIISFRDRFSALENYCHLISNSLGAMPDAARDGALAYTDAWSQKGVSAWKDPWMTMSRNVGDRLATIMNAPPDSVSMHPNVTSATATLLSCLDIAGRRNKVVMVEHEFPSLLYLYREWVRDEGRVEVVPAVDAISFSTEALLDAIDEQTLLVPISHVLFRSSYKVDVEAIVEKAHRVGAKVVLDVFQSLGCVPVYITKWNVDFAVGGCLKWLCGGPGACFLYVRPELAATLTPRFTGWLAHVQPFEFSSGAQKYAAGANRFISGTPVIPALYTCQAGLEIISEVGVDAIRTRSLQATDHLLGEARKRGWPVTTPADGNLRGGTVAFNIPNAESVAAELCARNILVDFRPRAGIRISPHFYNTDDELNLLVHEIETIIKSTQETTPHI